VCDSLSDIRCLDNFDRDEMSTFSVVCTISSKCCIVSFLKNPLYFLSIFLLLFKAYLFVVLMKTLSFYVPYRDRSFITVFKVHDRNLCHDPLPTIRS
jgi:hypothetical protein